MQSRPVEALAEHLQRVLPKEQEKKERLPVPLGGINTNKPGSELAVDESPSIVNMFVLEGRLRPDTGYVPFGSGAIEGTPQIAFQVNHSAGNQDTILVTTKKAYYLSLDKVWTSDGAPELNGGIDVPVSVVSYAPFDWIIITNGVDPVFYFYLGAFHLMPFDVGITTCRSLAVFHESLLLVGTTESDGKHARRVRMSDAGNPTAIKTIIEGADTGIAAIYDLLDTDDDLHVAQPLGPWLILYRHSSIMRATYLGALNQILFWEYMITGEGAQSVGSVCPVTMPQNPAFHVVVGAYNVYQYTGYYSLTPIADVIWQKWFSATGYLNQDAKSKIWCQYIPNYHEVWIGIPTNESMVPDTVLRLSVETQRVAWFRRRFADVFLSATTLLSRFEENQSVPNVLLAGPTGVYSYDFVTPDDAGDPIEWRFETKDIGEGGSVSRFDRLLVRGEGAFDVGVEVSFNHGHTWRFVDTVNFAFAQVAMLTFGFTSEYLRVRLSGSDPSFRLVWLELWYLFESEWVPVRVLA